MFARSFQAAESPAHHCSRGCPLRRSLVTAELIPAIGCSFMTTVYTQRAPSRVRARSCPLNCDPRTRADYLGQAQSDASAQDVLDGSCLRLVHLQPSPGVMFTSCLVLGCCVSSFLYRHHNDDPYQALVFTSAIVGSVVVGQIAGADLNLILLGFVPWALCTAMFLSVCGHATLRWMGARSCAEDTVMDDKTALLP